MMDMSNEKYNLAKIAYRSAWFRWVPGMVTRSCGLIVIHENPISVTLHNGEIVDPGSILPDMGHPATIGIVEHVLLPEKWGKCKIKVSRMPMPSMNVSILVEGKDEFKFTIFDEPADKAFSAALAAPLGR